VLLCLPGVRGVFRKGLCEVSSTLVKSSIIDSILDVGDLRDMVLGSLLNNFVDRGALVDVYQVESVLKERINLIFSSGQ